LDWIITYDDAVADDLKKLGHTAQIRIKKYLDKLASECSHPKDRGEPYRNELHGFWKYRGGDYRIISVIEEEEITILAVMMVSHRSKSYSDKSIKDLVSRSEELETLIENAKK
jgi:mRNA interferase RelE/StbE